MGGRIFGAESAGKTVKIIAYAAVICFITAAAALTAYFALKGGGKAGGYCTLSVGNAHIAAVKENGGAVAAGSSRHDRGQCDVGGWSDIVSVSAGNWHTIGLKTDGTVVAAGDQEKGRCDGGGWSGIVSVS
ncbi:MAG: hypothetical protein LUD81_01235, partial [Clostridiales bacterium]|nr:hypothetical protein [Clostridiales bacterium]